MEVEGKCGNAKHLENLNFAVSCESFVADETLLCTN